MSAALSSDTPPLTSTSMAVIAFIGSDNILAPAFPPIMSAALSAGTPPSTSNFMAFIASIGSDNILAPAFPP
eukprot:CAMPEP_0182490316 /NCGR_PEP_ID=MMETSP1321-20130603/223_1 /TAXON_ID=91990 /ORGANISM="Bolidomonas sp., Strain RCC1657" /LENGTH=71 /DNA_ID=CAMNT_0024692477 /DNA_START=21 /DNA_END=232 /DNA_ORIENTATION=-